MKTKFGYYYEMSANRQKEFNDSCVYVLDTNVLLDILRLGYDLANKIIEVLSTLRDRIAVPYYVGKEYHKHFLEIVHSQKECHTKALSKIENKVAVDAVLNALCNGVRISPSLREEINNHYSNATSFLLEKIKIGVDYYTELEKDRNLINKLAYVLDGKVMDQIADKDIVEYEKEGEKRYEAKRPPGYKDNNKRDNKYGDYIIWCEILKYAVKNKCDICFVSGDLKEDWWHKINKKNICPRYELQEEFQLKCTGKFFKIITLHKFLEEAGKMVEKDINDVKELITPDNVTELSPDKIIEIGDSENKGKPFTELINIRADEENE